ncbi:MAG: ABC transporter ATP-binding protein [Cellulomonadaceae bacterium]
MSENTATRRDPARTAVVEVSNLRKTYGTTVAVQDVSFTVEAGEIFGILGPNGAGKTTTVECLAGLRRADGGSVRVLGHDPQRDPYAVREHLGVQLQESELNDRITVREAMLLFASFYPDPADVGELLELLDLTGHADQRFGTLSGGQKQRLSIALALVGRPRVAILDELTTGLDPQARRATWQLVERVRDTGVTILLVTHFMDEAERLCDRLVVIDHGTVVAEGRPVDLIDGLEETRALRLRFAEDERSRALAAVGDLADVHAIDHEDDVVVVTGTRKVLPAVVLALAEIDVVPDDVQTVPRTLEDVFVQVTGRRYGNGPERAPQNDAPTNTAPQDNPRAVAPSARRPEGARR